MRVEKAVKPIMMREQASKRSQMQALTILFADISKSSRIYERLGDQAAQDLIGRVLALLSEQAGRFEGRVVKTVGDAVICTFAIPDRAVEAAKSMMQAMARPLCGAPEMPDMPHIHIHIGIHHGSVIAENGDIFGDAVNTAARVVDYANPRQIVATRAALRSLTAGHHHSSRYLGSITVKKISGAIELIEIVYEPQDLTTVLDTCKLADASCRSALYLTWGDQVVVVDRERPVVSVGREDYNDLVIKYAWISRTHAYIENRKGVFILSDKSTNGTFIYPRSEAPHYINKGEQALIGEGAVIFGREEEPGAAEELRDTLKYAIR